MKSRVARGLLVAILQLMIVGTLAAKFAHDRAVCPRVWVKIAYYDPDLPIRGRYAALQVELQAPGVFSERPLVEDRRNQTPAAIVADPCAQPRPGTQNAGGAVHQPHYAMVSDSKPVRLEVHDGQLVAIDDPKSNIVARYLRDADGRSRVFLQDQIDFFLPENATNLPAWRWPDSHGEWWVEVTIPRKGPPRPIRLGIKRGDGSILPLPVS